MGSGASDLSAKLSAASNDDIATSLSGLNEEGRAKVGQALADPSKMLMLTFTYEYAEGKKDAQNELMNKLNDYYRSKGEFGNLMFHLSFCQFKDGYTAVEVFRDAAAMQQHFDNTMAAPKELMDTIMSSSTEGWYKEKKPPTIYGTDEEVAKCASIKEYYPNAVRVVGPPPPEKLKLLGNYFGWKKPLVLSFKFKWKEEEKMTAFLDKTMAWAKEKGEYDTVLLANPFVKTEGGYEAMECFSSAAAFEQHCAHVMLSDAPFADDIAKGDAFGWFEGVEEILTGEADEKAKAPSLAAFYPNAKQVDEAPELKQIGNQLFQWQSSI